MEVDGQKRPTFIADDESPSDAPELIDLLVEGLI